MNEYSIELFDSTGEPFAGASVPAGDDEAANDEARELALEHGARFARVRCKGDGRSWLLECESYEHREHHPRNEASELRELVDVLCENRDAGYLNGWTIERSAESCVIRAEGADRSKLEATGATWEAAKNAFADALIEYLERLAPVGRG